MKVEEDERKDKASEKRKRTSRACDQCNQLRTKCDGLYPCGHCKEVNIECQYRRVPMKRGKAALSYIESLSRKAKSGAATGGGVSPQKLSPSSQDRSPALGQSVTPPQAPPQSVLQSGQSQGQGKSQSQGHNSQYQPQHQPQHQPQLQPQLQQPQQPHSQQQQPQQQPQHPPHPHQHQSHALSHPQLPSLQSQLSPISASHLPRLSVDHMSAQLHMPSSLGELGDPLANPLTPSLTESLQTQPLPVQMSAHQAQVPRLGQGTVQGNGSGSNGSGSNRSNSVVGTGQDGYGANGPNGANNQPPNRNPSTGQVQLSPLLEFSDQSPTSWFQSYYANQSLFEVNPGAGPSGSASSNGNTSNNRSNPLNQKYRHYPILDPVLEPLAPTLDEDLVRDLLETYFEHSTHVLAYLVRRRSILHTSMPRRTTPALIYAILLVAAHHSDNPQITGSPQARQVIVDKLMDLTISHLTTTKSMTSTGCLDDVITYIQLGTVVSASEYKGSSMRWWGLAWNLAKELNLNVENTAKDPETREEQRRTWWLLYMVDRHLALCYNRPLNILDSESTDLFRPVDEDLWQTDEALLAPEMDSTRALGIQYIVSGQDIYGYFLPLMSILGTLIEIHHSEQNPSLPLKDVTLQLRTSVRSYLDRYHSSLRAWSPSPCANAYDNAWRDYAFHLVNVFYILSTVSWDPLELLEQADQLLSNPDMAKVSAHAVSAAKCVRRILTIDPDLRLMPFFLGIYLLQGSFVLLAIVNRVESEASQDVFSACETIVHAHEVCIVTLNTEYQRNFRKVMRSTMSLLVSDQTQPQPQDNTPNSLSSLSPTNHLSNGSSYEDGSRDKVQAQKDDARRKSQALLGLYRWTPGGHGLAV